MNDLRVAVRRLRNAPTFVIVVLVILGLGIGVAVAMFTTFHTILVRRLPVEDQDRIVMLWPYRESTLELSPPVSDLAQVRRESRTMTNIAGIVHSGPEPVPFLDGDRTTVLSTTAVTANFFDVLGARPALGRLLRLDDEAPGGSPAVVLSYSAWQSQFGGSPSVIGRQLVDAYLRNPVTIVGVAAPGLDYPVGIGVWIGMPRGIGPRVLTVARLAPGASIDAARGEFFSIMKRVEPALQLRGAGAQTFTTAVLGDVRPVLVALTAAVALLLLIACTNVGTLFLMRAASRTRELAVRRALGASYGDLVRGLAVESSLLAIGGGAVGILCAYVLLRALVAFAPATLPRLDELRLHNSVLLVAVAVTTLCVMLFGLLPALSAARANLATPLRGDARSGTETRRRRLVRQWLVASQVALAVVVLAGAGVLARSLRRLEHLQLGYGTEHVSVLSIAFNSAIFSSTEKMARLGDQLEQRLKLIPGVTAVTPLRTLPFRGANMNVSPFESESGAADGDDGIQMVPVETAGPQYLRTFGIPVLRGRGILESDVENAPAVVVLSESVARRFWPGQQAIGKRIRFAPSTVSSIAEYPNGYFDWRTVVGVVGDTHFRELRNASPTVYFPFRQLPDVSGHFAVRSSVSLAGLAPVMRSAVRDVNPTLELWDVRSMDQLLDGPLAKPRLNALLLSSFGVAALLLAAIGLYGVMASAVREQTREIGIRMAVGATPGRIRSSVLRESLIVAGAGAGVGLCAALITNRLLRALLFEVSASDPVTLASVCFVLLAVALLAGYMPARRAMRIEILRALYAE